MSFLKKLQKNSLKKQIYRWGTMTSRNVSTVFQRELEQLEHGNPLQVIRNLAMKK